MSAGGDNVIEARGLSKTYRSPLARRRVEAVRDVSFSVAPGQTFGFLGPNGAGKTTTIRILMGLIKASGGRAHIFGHSIPSREARARIGFLPEAPYFYDYLTVIELCDLAARLYGVDRKTRRKRIGELVELVGLAHASQQPLKSYSKGMLQRAGIAQALVSNPDLVILDEPMGGLDPVGRKEVRDIIHRLAEEGKTVFFSSHILADVELICDHVAFIVKGRMQGSGALSELIDSEGRGTEVSVWLPEGEVEANEAAAALSKPAEKARRGGGRKLTVLLPPASDVDGYLAGARERGARVISVVPAQATIEELFIRRTEEPAADEPDPEKEPAADEPDPKKEPDPGEEAAQ